MQRQSITLTVDQVTLVEKCNKNLLTPVHGCAGVGKTECAIEAARMFNMNSDVVISVLGAHTAVLANGIRISRSRSWKLGDIAPAYVLMHHTLSKPALAALDKYAKGDHDEIWARASRFLEDTYGLAAPRAAGRQGSSTACLPGPNVSPRGVEWSRARLVGLSGSFCFVAAACLLRPAWPAL